MEFPPYHPFRSEQARQEYLAYYDQRAGDWPVASETRMVETSLGQTFVRISGPQDAPPLVLLPAAVFNSLMWIPNVAALSQVYRVYAVDNIYDCGRSIYMREIKNPAELTGWLDELFSALNLGNAINLMGLSYGSWLSQQYAFRFPKRVRKLVLLAHPTIASMNVSFIFRFLLAFFSPRWFKSFVYWLFEDMARQSPDSEKIVEIVFRGMQLAGNCFAPKAMVNPTPVKDNELIDFPIPTLFLVGANEKTFPPHKATRRLNKLAPQIQTEIIPAAGHDLNFAQADLVNQKVLQFLA